MKGLSRRADSLWIALATNSFPVPVSPWIKTVLVGVAATSAIWAVTTFMAGDSPMSWSSPGETDCR